MGSINSFTIVVVLSPVPDIALLMMGSNMSIGLSAGGAEEQGGDDGVEEGAEEDPIPIAEWFSPLCGAARTVLKAIKGRMH
jgi:hypothetical protein